jgi:4-amino-4-deoxy-L-arabinose transferase-like glycosyltransferase
MQHGAGPEIPRLWANVWAWLGKRPGWGVLIVAIAIVKGLIWTQLLPPWYGPDEMAHYDYVQQLALTATAPAAAPLRPDERDVPLEVRCAASNVGFGVDGPYFAEPPFVPNSRPCHMPPTGQGRLARSPTNPAGFYGPAYYALAVPFWLASSDSSPVVRVEAVRLLSVLLGGIAALFCYLAGFWAFSGDRRLASVSAIVFSLQPMLSQQTAIVTNDALLIAVGTAFFWILFRAIRRSPNVEDMILLGLLAGLAYWAKPQGALLACLVPVAVLPRVCAARFDRSALTSAARWLAIAAVPAILLVLVEIVLQSLLRSSAMPLGTTPAAPDHTFHHYFQLLQDRGYAYLGFLSIWTFWGAFGWFSVALPAAAFEVVAGVVMLSLAGLCLRVWRHRGDRWLVAAAVGSVLFIWLALLVVEAVYYRSTGGQLLQGRDSFMALSPLAIMLVAGLLLPLPRAVRGLAGAWLCAGALGLQLMSWGVLLEAFFS